MAAADRAEANRLADACLGGRRQHRNRLLVAAAAEELKPREDPFGPRGGLALAEAGPETDELVHSNGALPAGLQPPHRDDVYGDA